MVYRIRWLSRAKCVFLILVSLIVSSGLVSTTIVEHQPLKPSGVIGHDDRKPVDSWDAPWNAVGRVHLPKAGRVDICTGTLIDPKIVVTAAHCVHNMLSGKPVQPLATHFLAGYRKEKYIAHSVAECIKINSDYKFKRKISLELSKADYAFIVLKKPMNIPAVKIYEMNEIEKGNRLVHAGYCCDRLYLLSVHDGCEAKYKKGDAYLTNCDTAKGASGGPVFVKQNGEHYIAGVLSSMFVLDDGTTRESLNAFASILHERKNLDLIKSCD